MFDVIGKLKALLDVTSAGEVAADEVRTAAIVAARRALREEGERALEPTEGKRLALEDQHHRELEAAKQRRFFLYIHTMDAHSPYYVHKGITDGFLAGRPYRGGLRAHFTDADGEKPLDEEDQRYVRALYDGEIVYHDQHLGRLIDALRETGLLSQTLLVYTNDHGEELFDHGGKVHGHSLYEELLRCPLLLRYPPLFPAGQRVTDSVELVDLAPTVLEALGLPPLTRAHGRSLLQPPVPSLQYAVAQGEAPPHGLAFAVQVGPFKLLQWSENHSLYDLRGEGADRADIAGDHPVALRLCQILLTEALAVPSKALRQRGPGGGDRFKHHEAIVDPKTRKQLEALGYIK